MSPRGPVGRRPRKADVKVTTPSSQYISIRRILVRLSQNYIGCTMKITAAAVTAIGCVQYTSAFVGPQFGQRAHWSSKIQMQGKESREVPTWVGPMSTAVAGFVFASQTVGATVVDRPVHPFVPVVEIVNGNEITP